MSQFEKIRKESIAVKPHEIAALLKVAIAATQHKDAADTAAEAKSEYYDACREWKREHGYARYEKLDAESEAKQQMLDEASDEARIWAVAKREEYNALRRLHTAIRQARRVPE